MKYKISNINSDKLTKLDWQYSEYALKGLKLKPNIQVLINDIGAIYLHNFKIKKSVLLFSSYSNVTSRWIEQPKEFYKDYVRFTTEEGEYYDFGFKNSLEEVLK